MRIWFLSCLKEAIPETTGMTLISDRDKGLEAVGDTVNGDTVQRLICCFHLKGLIFSIILGVFKVRLYGAHPIEQGKSDIRPRL